MAPHCLPKWDLGFGYDINLYLGVVAGIQLVVNTFVYCQEDLPNICMGSDRFAEEVPPSLNFRMRVQSIFEHIQNECQFRLPGEARQNNSCATVFFQPEFEGVILPVC